MKQNEYGMSILVTLITALVLLIKDITTEYVYILFKIEWKFESIKL